MGSIYQRATGGAWYFQWNVAGKSYRKSLKTTDKATAKRLQKLYEAKLEAAVTGLAPKRFKFEDAFDRFLEHKQATLKPARPRGKKVSGLTSSVVW